MKEEAKRRRGWLGFLPFFVLAFFLVLAFLYQGNLDARATVGEEAPDFELPLLDGGTARLSDFRGRTVVVNFWTTWCKECGDELPDLQRVYQGRDDVTVLGVNMREAERVVRPFVQDHGATFPILMDQERKVARTYRVTGVPETWIVSSDGIARFHFIGPVTAQHIERALEQLASTSASGEV